MNERAVHAVVVAYRTPEQLDRCLARLERWSPVTVVDNSSSAAVQEVAARHGAMYTDSGRNIGFAAAVNVALERLAKADCDVLLLNPDAVIGRGDVRRLARHLHHPGNERVAAVAPRLRGEGGREERVGWPFPTPIRMCAEAVGLGRLPARRRFVTGAVLLLRREAIDDVGPFDERFFLYAEEADWQRRAYARGWTSAVCTDVVAEHAGAASSTDPRRREALFHAAQETYVRKWHGASGWWLYRAAACTGAAGRAIVLRRERRRAAVARLLLYLEGPRRRAALGQD